jgi:hypothetical protein
MLRTLSLKLTGEISIVPKASTQSYWRRCLARGRVRVPVSCLTKLKNELHRQQRVSIVVGKFIKGNNESSGRKWGVLSGLPEK